MQKKPLVISSTFFILILGACNSFAIDQGTIKIGVVAPLTGNSAYLGEEIARTIQVIQMQLQESSSKYGFQFILEDGKAAADSSPTTAAKKLISSDEVKFLITATSGETLQVAPLAQASKVITFAVYSGHPDVKLQGRYIFRTFIDIEKGIAKISDRIRLKGHTPFALLTEEHAFTMGIKTIFIKQFIENDIFLLDYPFESLDLRSILLRIKSTKPKSLYLNCSTPKTCSIITNQLRQLRIDLPLYSYIHMEMPEYLENVKSNAEGILFLALPNIETTVHDYQNFIAIYKNKFGYTPRNDFLSRSTYDAIGCIINGVEERGRNTELILQYLANYKMKGALGDISFDENGDIQDINYAIKIIKDGRPIFAED